MNLFQRIGLIMGMAFIQSAVAVGAPMPPNTIDMTAHTPAIQNHSLNTTSPVIAQSPYAVQPYIVPSTQSMIRQEVIDYLNAQLTPDQLMTLKTYLLEKERIGATPYVTLPTPVVRSLAVNLAPGETLPIIRVAKNMLTSIVFTDMDGNPWYIEKVVVNRNQFSDSASLSSIANAQANIQAVQQVGDNATGLNTTPTENTTDPTANLTNILTLEPLKAVDYGNVSVTLRGKAVPVIFMVMAGQNEVDIRLDAKVPGKNPDISYTLNSPLTPVTANRYVSTPEIDTDALGFLDGTIPEDATNLISSDVSVQAWSYNDKIYVKTRLDVLYPNYMSKAASNDGTKIYRFDGDVFDITFLQRHGQPVTVSLEDSKAYYHN
ncbi:DotH/IcmK family type IV secretion protein (plasmid) [Moraxella bovis]|uniref:DotH/IcmK family type IV secretion protein n=1 Tax=Moraxella bovis TaxID=476 RepID=A0ABY6MB85_MORBO|nr:DotH/IcmK family type IV secretion protein [Moraxella bovis]UZA04807.1 DotH/IcmK family type IV secretion protein [Moraxella bovis]